MKLQGSNFVSLAGLIVLLALVLVCAYLGFTVLEAFLVVILILCLVAYLWAKFSLGNIRVEMEESEVRAFPGQTFSSGARLTNAKFLPLLWLDLRLVTGGNTCIAPVKTEGEADEEDEEDKNAISESFAWLMPHQSLSWRQQAAAVHRGVCSVEKAALMSGDGFGLTVQSREEALAAPFRFVVYPKPMEVDIKLILNNMSELEPVKNGFYTDRTLLSGTRDYHEGDSFRDINWRVLARSGQLQVNVHEQLSMRRVCFVPDLESFTYKEIEEGDCERRVVTRVRGDETERMISMLAGMIIALNEREVLCTMVIPSVGEKEARIIIPEVRADQITEHLTALAEIEYSGEKTRLPVDEMLGEMHKLGQVYILSYDLKNAGGAAAGEDLNFIRILQCPGESDPVRKTFTETDITLV